MRQLKLVLGNRNYSSWSLRAWLVLKFADREFDCEIISLFTEQGTARLKSESPNGRVPFLIAGDMVLSESMAIAEYIAEISPAKKLWPEDQVKRAQARSICLQMCSGFFALRNEMPMNVRRKNKPIDASDDCWRDIARIEEIWSSMREKYAQTGDFLFGEKSIADAFFAPVVWRLNSYVDKAKLKPETLAYMKVMMALPEMQGWAAMAKEESWVIEKAEV